MSGYSIDKRGETTRQDMRVNGTAVTLAENTYDESGRLKTSKPASNESLKLTYDYNVRSWLTNIAGQKFTERLYYNIPFESGTPRYNGNISTAMWNLWDYYLGFNYTYDNLSRLTAGQSFLQWEDDAPGTSYGAYDTWYRYDRNGNMTALSRLEDLSLEEVDISHSGNQISRITNKGDLYPDYYSGFVSYSDGSAYAYNANGAMTSDPDKGARYAYNAFGMPSQVKVPAILGSIDYKYSATGERLEASYKWHSGLSLDPQENLNRPTYTVTNSSKLRQYVGNKVYENGSLKRILLDNGYIEGGIYYFYLRDHLGNNSVVTKANGQVVQRNHYYPYGKVIGNGESSGQAAQPYKFGGKEEETMFGLELYDFHARQMDRRIPGFLTVDPMAEKYYSISPYAYCGGNPIRLVDVNGKEWGIIVNANGTMTITLNTTISSGSNLNLTAAQLDAYKTAISTQLNSTISEASGGLISASVSFDGAKDPSRYTPNISLSGAGSTIGFYAMGHNTITINPLLGENMQEVAETVSHELFHTLALGELSENFSINGILDTQLNFDKTLKSYATTSATDKDLLNNIMNYGYIKIDNVSYKEVNGSNVGMNKLTKGQLNFIIQSIYKQMAGYGLVPTKESNESNEEY